MANFPPLRYNDTGKILYVTLHNASGHYWDTVAGSYDNPMVVAQWANYDVAATETPASSYQYIVTVPDDTDFTTNAYVYLTYYERATGSVLITDPVVARAFYWWDGTTVREAPPTASGAGSITHTYTVYAGPGATNPIEGAQVYVTSDEAGANVVAGTKTTNSSGVVLFYLDAGTYYFWVSHGSYNFTLPDTETVA